MRHPTGWLPPKARAAITVAQDAMTRHLCIRAVYSDPGDFAVRHKATLEPVSIIRYKDLVILECFWKEQNRYVKFDMSRYQLFFESSIPYIP